MMRVHKRCPLPILWPMYTMASVLKASISSGFWVKLKTFLRQIHILGKGTSQLGCNCFECQPMLLFLEPICYILDQGFYEEQLMAVKFSQVQKPSHCKAIPLTRKQCCKCCQFLPEGRLLLEQGYLQGTESKFRFLKPLGKPPVCGTYRPWASPIPSLCRRWKLSLYTWPEAHPEMKNILKATSTAHRNMAHLQLSVKTEVLLL